MEGGTRAFIAVEIPEKVKKEIAKLAAELECGSARPVSESQMHITLLFLGNLGGQEVSEVSDALSKIRYKEFEISINGAGTFSRRNPNVIFAGVGDGSKDLEKIHRMISEELSGLHIKLEERKFFPHTTIARVHRPSPSDISYIDGFVAAHSEDSIGSFKCREIKLKGSLLTHEGPEYTDIFSVYLKP
ncbi:MAG TPA: RNA 2',3'-cyclic phosphodiesterase [Candidatus Acidoferrum sp.]|nr:RNA 2',3'-cyclic phosphodiesterase [Candidatus Acidoferrum sp.]